jgi:hypothetical protein
MFQKLIIRIIGKRLDANLDKWGISKTKIVAIIGVIIYGVEHLSPVFNHPITVPNDVYSVLGALGLWTLRDGQDTAAKAATPKPQ